MSNNALKIRQDTCYCHPPVYSAVQMKDMVFLLGTGAKQSMNDATLSGSKANITFGLEIVLNLLFLNANCMTMTML